MDEKEHGQPYARQPEGDQKSGRIPVPQCVDVQEVLAAPIGHGGGGGAREGVTQPEKSSSLCHGNDLGEQEVEDDPLDSDQETEEEEEESDCNDGIFRAQEQAGQRDPQDLDPHAGPHPETHAEHLLPMFNQAGPEEGREEHPKELQRTCEPDDELGAGKHQDIGGDQGRGIDQPETGLPQKSMQQMRKIVATEVAVYLLVVTLLGSDFVRSDLSWARVQRAFL